MANKEHCDFIIGSNDPILITGANGFIGLRVVENLVDRGFRELICLTRPSSNSAKLEALVGRRGSEARIRVVKGNLLSREDCAAGTKGVAAIFHLAAGGSDKSFPDAFMSTVVTTRNLLDASVQCESLKRFVNVSSFAVYSNMRKPQWRLLDESCPIETRPDLRGDAYCFAKTKQDAIVAEYGERFGLPYVIVRPGYVYGPGKQSISSRVGIDTFGIFLHLGGSNMMPFTYVDNCADAIVMAGLKRGVEGEVFNIVDDDLPSSRQFLRLHKRNVARFNSVYLPHLASHSLCWMWEKCSKWSEGQLPPSFNLRRWHALWKKTRYSNEKLKTRVGWIPKISTGDGLRRYFEGCRDGGSRA
jgi:nucleoside-diphosphate-sugar epimerase